MHQPSPSTSEAGLLALWEAALGQGGPRRAAALLGDEEGTLGARNLALLGLRNARFARRWPMLSRCSGCGEECEFELDSQALEAELARIAAGSPGIVDWRGRELAARPFVPEDLEAASACRDRAEAARALLGRCLSGDIEPETLSDEEVEVLGERIEALDPAASLAFSLACPACGTRWSAALDIAESLWAEVERAAERVLTEVDALARAYGWTEAEVLRLSPLRRAAYLQLAEEP